MYNPEDWG